MNGCCCRFTRVEAARCCLASITVSVKVKVFQQRITRMCDWPQRVKEFVFCLKKKKNRVVELNNDIWLDIFTRLDCRTMSSLVTVYPHLLKDIYFRILFENDGSIIRAWEATERAYYLQFVPSKTLQILLRRAAYEMNRNKVMLLLRNGADARCLDVPLKGALRYGDQEFANWLKGVLINRGCYHEETYSETIHPSSSSSGSIDMAKINEKWESLIWQRSTVALLQRLITAGANINTKGNNGTTALIRAAMKGRLETVKWLIKEGADLNLSDDTGKTALYWAVVKGRSLELIRTLIEAGASVDNCNCCGDTALMQAALRGYTEMVKCLVEAGANVNHMDLDCRNVLIYASPTNCRTDNHATLKTILTTAGAKEPEDESMRVFVRYSLYLS